MRRMLCLLACLPMGVSSVACGGNDASLPGGTAGAGATGGAGATDGSAGAGGRQLPPACETLPTGGLYATVGVSADDNPWQPGDEYFHAQILDPEAIRQALADWAAGVRQILSGALVCQPAGYNCTQSWHLDPDTIVLSDTAIEVCDGLPSYVEAHCEQFAAENVRYCPWTTDVIELRDCRTDPSCPPVPRGGQ